MQSNTPVTLPVNAGCNRVIVTRLSDASLWDRTTFPGTIVLEINPQWTLQRHEELFSGIKDLLGFNELMD